MTPVYPDEVRQRALRLSREGVPDGKVSAIVGPCEKTIRAWRNAAEIPAMRPTRKRVGVVDQSTPSAPGATLTRPQRPCVETDANGSVINQKFPHSL